MRCGRAVAVSRGVTRMGRMSAADALTRWLAAVIPNDQFLLYCFDVPATGRVDLDATAEGLLARACRIDDLRLRVLDVPATLDRPRWVRARVYPDQALRWPDRTWSQCLATIGRLTADHLDPARRGWRIHLFGPIADAPDGGGDAVVAVLQISHALGDGRRTAQIARDLFSGRDIEPNRRSATPRGLLGDVGLPALAAACGAARLPWAVTETVARGMIAWHDSKRSRVAKPTGVMPTVLNRPPGDDRVLRTLVFPTGALRPRGHTVTVGALTAISVALPDYLGDRDRRYAAELTVGRTRTSGSRNDFRNCGIDLHADVADLGDRADAIAADVEAARTTAETPAMRSARAASAATPAMLTRWGVARFDPTIPPPTVTGVTVVSSVYRGPADLEMCGGPVRFTAGFPALSPAQGLTHGVHGIGDTVAVSVVTSPRICPDVDDYVDRLAAAVLMAAPSAAN